MFKVGGNKISLRTSDIERQVCVMEPAAYVLNKVDSLELLILVLSFGHCNSLVHRSADRRVLSFALLVFTSIYLYFVVSKVTCTYVYFCIRRQKNIKFHENITLYINVV